jgi:copper chaperone for superoxide dismutase
MVQVAENMTIVDLSIRGLQQGKYWATVRECGDISRGPESTGGIWESTTLKASQREGGARPGRGIWGCVEIGTSGVGSLFTDKPVQIWELIGRSIVVAKQKEGPFDAQDENALVGVVARSAGVWENEKVVCACSGKTVWEERVEQVGKGML